VCFEEGGRKLVEVERKEKNKGRRRKEAAD
jgi:hypothetical protein